MIIQTNYKQDGPGLTARIALSIRLVSGEKIDRVVSRLDFTDNGICYFDIAANESGEIAMSRIASFSAFPTIEVGNG